MQFTGKVVRGLGRGRELGFPTANLTVDGGAERLPRGVFAAIVKETETEELSALANIGTRPTFAEDQLAVELHILDYQGDLYDRKLEIALIEKLREERAFAGPGELIAQIREDIHQVRNLFDDSAGAQSI